MKMTMMVHVNGRTYTSAESINMTEKERDGAIDEIYKSIETLVKLRMDTENLYRSLKDYLEIRTVY